MGQIVSRPPVLPNNDDQARSSPRQIRRRPSNLERHSTRIKERRPSIDEWVSTRFSEAAIERTKNPIQRYTETWALEKQLKPVLRRTISRSRT